MILNDAGPHADDLAIALRADPRLDGYDARLRQRGAWYQILVPVPRPRGGGPVRDDRRARSRTCSPRSTSRSSTAADR